MNETTDPISQIPPTSPEFSVYQFFVDGSQERYLSFVQLQQAVRGFRFLTTNVAAKFGITKRVIVTDGGDCVCLEWIDGKVTFPPEEENPS